MHLPARLLRSSVLCLLSAAAAGLAGCSLVPAPMPDPTRYYVLTGRPAEGAREAKAERPLVLGVKRIEIASYLNGKDMVVRARENEIRYESFSRWAEPLTASIGRAVAARLASSEAVGRVYAQPFPFEVERDYDVAIRVLRCEGVAKDDGTQAAGLSALVEVTEARPGGSVVFRTLFTAPETAWDGRDYAALASALSDGVAALGDAVVAALPRK